MMLSICRILAHAAGWCGGSSRHAAHSERRSQSPTHIESRFIQLGHLQKKLPQEGILREHHVLGME